MATSAQAGAARAGLYWAGVEPGYYGLPAAGYLPLFASAPAYFYWNRGVTELGAAKAGLSIHSVSVFALLRPIVLLREQVRAFHLLGMALIFMGIYLATILAKSSSGLSNGNNDL